MELIFKYYKDKPCKIGVKYLYKYQALNAYEKLIRNYPAHIFSLTLEPVNTKINLTLQSELSGIKIHYNGLEYKAVKLKDYLSLIKSGVKQNFVHVYTAENNLLIAKPFNKEEFCSISSIQLVGKDQY